MKIAAGKIDGFVEKPAPGIHAVLVYGPDSGLVTERAEVLIEAVAGTLDDAFRISEIGAGELRNDPARLRDEAAALSLTGGRRVVRIRQGTDRLSEMLAPILEHGPARDGDDGAMIVIEAGPLGPRSALRRLVEAAPNAAALACYGDEGRGLEAVIRQTLSANGLGAGPETLAYLCAHLGGDRMITRNEIAKLALYVGGESEVRLADAEACIGDSAALGLDDLIDQAATGKRAELDRTLCRLYLEGTSPITVLRAAARHFQSLHYVSGTIAAGEPMDLAIKALRPPLFFKRKANFQAQLQQWPPERLAAVLASLTRAEADCKTTGMPAGAICARALMRIAYDARRSGSGRSRPA